MDKLLGLTLDNDDNKKEIVAWTSTDREATCRHGFIGPVSSTTSPHSHVKITVNNNPAPVTLY